MVEAPWRASLIDPRFDGRRLKAPELAHLNTVYLAAVHEPLKRSGMNLEHRRGLVAVEQWFFN
jgi:hypothetical protein